MEKFRAYRIHGEGGKTLARFDTMALGTAGYTAALAIHLMEQNDLRPGDGKVLVNGDRRRRVARHRHARRAAARDGAEPRGVARGRVVVKVS